MFEKPTKNLTIEGRMKYFLDTTLLADHVQEHCS